DRADQPQPAVVARRRRGERAAPGVAVEPPLLHEHVQGLAHGGPAHLEPGAERMLGGDALTFPFQIAAQRLGDLEVPRYPGPEVHRRNALRCQDVWTSNTAEGVESTRRPRAGDEKRRREARENPRAARSLGLSGRSP